MNQDRMPILVVKVGTSTLLNAHDMPVKTFDYIAESIIALMAEYRIVLVTSGAIGFGATHLKLDERPSDVASLQSLAMIGQVGLLKRWREALEPTAIGQVLLTTEDLRREGSTQRITDSIQQLWGYGVLPIVNENDAVSTDEITFGDNDQLAADVAVALGAERLVLLTDQDGIQKAFGTPQQERLQVAAIDEVEQHIAPTKSLTGKGGANSKILAAKRALHAGVDVFIAHAASEQSIERALSGLTGTKLVQ